MSNTQDLGLVTAYGYAVAGGYTGTEEEFYTHLGGQAAYYALAQQAAEDAAESAEQAMSGTPDGYASLVSTVNSLNSALTVKTVTYSPIVDGLSGQLIIKKYGRICWATFSVSGTAAFAALEVGADVYTITDNDYKPVIGAFAMANGRTIGAWGSADYYPITIHFTPDGSVELQGKTSELHACSYVTASWSYISKQ